MFTTIITFFKLANFKLPSLRDFFSNALKVLAILLVVYSAGMLIKAYLTYSSNKDKADKAAVTIAKLEDKVDQQIQINKDLERQALTTQEVTQIKTDVRLEATQTKETIRTKTEIRIQARDSQIDAITKASADLPMDSVERQVAQQAVSAIIIDSMWQAYCVGNEQTPECRE